MNFYESISEYYHYIFALNKAQASFVQESFDETHQKDLLDIGCGIGELSFELSKSFNSVHAIDLDKSMISRAKQGFGFSAGNINFNVLNMLEIERTFGANSMDAIVCFGNTLVHLKDSEQILEFLKQAKEVLKDEGKLLLQIINYDRIIDKKVDFLPTLENNAIKFVRNYRLHPDHKKLDFETILTIKKTGENLENTIQLYPILKKEIDLILNQAGFTEIKYYSNFKREAYRPASIPLIIEAK